eukprot:4459003-Pleurochrysis_carterae.AAC.1
MSHVSSALARLHIRAGGIGGARRPPIAVSWSLADARRQRRRARRFNLCHDVGQCLYAFVRRHGLQVSALVALARGLFLARAKQRLPRARQRTFRAGACFMRIAHR